MNKIEYTNINIKYINNNMEPTIIYLTRIPILTSFKPIRRIELLRSGVFNCHNESFIYTPVWEGGDLYPVNDKNWDKYVDCIKNNKDFEWQLETDI